jgi:hypothetical protein
MTRRPGHIRQRSPGSFEVRYTPGTANVKCAEQPPQLLLSVLTTALNRRGDRSPPARGRIPDKVTLLAWAEHWIAIGCPGQRRRKVGQLSQERYAQLLRMYVLPVLGGLKLQDLPRQVLRAFMWRWRND